MNPGARLLIIDDDVTLTKALELYLGREGHEVHTAPDGPSGLRAFYAVRPDLVLLDVMMPAMDGWETCRRLRELSTVPIVILSAKGQEADRVMGLSLGADDYVAKPFSLKEFVARIEAILRRTRWEDGLGERRAPYTRDDLTIDPWRFQAYLRGERLNLTAMEMKVLFHLVENAGRVLTHRQIMTQVWGPEYEDNVEYVKLYVWRLRQKLEDDPASPRYILTERGIGYRMAPAE
jgi:two-component system, OmpR family, KDP operon response regulator KdpE